MRKNVQTSEILERLVLENVDLMCGRKGLEGNGVK